MSQWSSAYNSLMAKKRELEIALSNREEIQVERLPDELDQALAQSNREVAVDRINRDRELLQRVIKAISKFSDGEYGRCEECGEEIPEKRLVVVPWAERCIRCQERLDLEEKDSGEPRKLRSYTERGLQGFTNNQKVWKEFR